jgi:hypothetical protein
MLIEGKQVEPIPGADMQFLSHSLQHALFYRLGDRRFLVSQERATTHRGNVPSF